MKRFVVLSILIVESALVGVHGSHAQDSGVVRCSTLPDGTPSYCVPTPTTPTPVPHNVTPNKSVSIGNPVTAPAGMVEYPLSITSQFVCFGLDEPIDLYLMGSPGAGMFLPVFPSGQSGAVSYDRVTVDPETGQGTVYLEMAPNAVGPAGLDLKVRWPQENFEQITNLVPPATPTPTATGQPPTPTATPAPTSTSTATTTPGSTATPAPTETPVPPPFSVRACVQPTILQGTTVNSSGDTGTLYGLTTPGTPCTAAVSFYRVGDLSNYTTTAYPANPSTPDPSTFEGSSQVAGSDGLVIYSFGENTDGDFGIGTVTCTPLDGSAPQTGCASFLISQGDTVDYLNSLSAADQSSLRKQLMAVFCPAGSNHL